MSDTDTALPAPAARLFALADQVTGFMPADEARALSGSADQTLRLWDLKTGAELRRFKAGDGAVATVAALADGLIEIGAGGGNAGAGGTAGCVAGGAGGAPKK